ncbi:MAG: indolepyruvate ferredoxin oxidoreductase subunit beta [Candidatus Bathyarchaeota archaeon]|jgi:indolepyruvate ferredoxin oxidoreductase beta subunit|nr:indolepyruvate ferredoxin oxidoreductase subunit beta [Candidatus Bathyarchaeota archaeon A05DMB-5]MDH7558063.1 indolepyruvate ferredoxin oxidoreductase subunit beta [Candidatus Bathyarchaeota archaeon]
MKGFNIVLTGVGGQGILLAAEILGTAALKEGLNVRVSEIHGMAQRGGAVVSNVRIGENVLAPTFLDGKADILLGFEPLETLRSLNFASEKTIIIMSDERITPTELTAKKMEYPSLKEITNKICSFTKNIIIVEAAKLAKEAGNILTENVVLIGALAATKKIPVKDESILEALKELVPTKHLGTNIKAFKLGYEYAQKYKLKH